MIQAVAIAITIILTSLFFFPFEFTFLPGVNTKTMMAAVGLLILLFRLAKGQKASIDRNIFIASGLAVIVSIWSYFSATWNETPDYTYATYIISMWVWLGGAYTVVSLIRNVHGQAPVHMICNYLIAVCALQCILALTMDVYTPVKRIIDSFYLDASYFTEHERLYGLGAALDVAGMKFSVVEIMIACMAITYGKSLSKQMSAFYAVSFLIIAMIGNMISRTTLIGVALALVYMLFAGNYWDTLRDKASKVKWWVQPSGVAS